ncbi:hypothetical protein P376_5738 [Streptomyces sp. HCCB10043]|uniref:Predicted protein n=1 Tax=Streptomyces filamentosus NRRL 15998 TaxID=457431 RepID=D6AKZ8_STRFL|nr:predicted protein [Streptomyces filamentosus NRRL 15998]ESU46281.1 hypothetical protein P376_5738 [Streptomyces sp. HCCB10043]EWS94314.1 hypothetical protein SSIG_04956 [Streptomyces filamentosus NRRL 11379]MYR81308.1 hypothetical protein [Streptomyces sp. SID5466]
MTAPARTPGRGPLPYPIRAGGLADRRSAPVRPVMEGGRRDGLSRTRPTVTTEMALEFADHTIRYGRT